MDIRELKSKGYYIGIIDGAKCNNIKSFLIEIGLAFQFPGYYGQNMDALDECINDLDWLTERNYALVINNMKDFLKDETFDERMSIIIFLYEVAEEWKSVPNFEGEEEFRHSADFSILLQ